MNQGVLNILPEKIQAVDMDTINSPIRYSFVSGVPDSYAEYFKIQPDTGAVHQIKAVEAATTKNFNIIIKVTVQFVLKLQLKKAFRLKKNQKQNGPQLLSCL